MFEYLQPPYRGRKEVLLYPFFPVSAAWPGACDKRPYVVGADDPKTWAEVLDREGIDRTVIYPPRHSRRLHSRSRVGGRCLPCLQRHDVRALY